jgi:hypothetical protein
MKSTDILYSILYHNKGYIRVEIPSLKKLPWSYLFENCKKHVPFPIPSGIKDFHINPFMGTIVITYEPDRIDILEQIRRIVKKMIV